MRLLSINHRIGDMIPADIAEEFHAGIRFEHPLTPAYYAEAIPEPPKETDGTPTMRAIGPSDSIRPASRRA